MDFFATTVTERAVELAGEVLVSTWLSEGSKVRAFEGALASQLGLVNPVAVNSGTSALHLALAIAGIGPGDEVILPPQTFLATGMVVLMQRAVPVFADIDPRDGNLCPQSVASKMTDRTRAILAVHWGGYPCAMDEIGRLAAERGVTVIEDAAHALGATYRGQPIGAVSRFSCFSFQAIKHVTAGDGGALCCLADDDYQQARNRRWFGIDREHSLPSLLGERQFDVREVGYKYHMNDLAAAVGLGNLEAFPQQLARRQQIAQVYRDQLAGVPGVELLRQQDDRTSACWLFTVLVERREDFVRKLRDQGIPTSVVHRRIDRYTVFGGVRPDLSGQEAFDRRQIALPTHHRLSETQVEAVVRAIRSGW